LTHTIPQTPPFRFSAKDSVFIYLERRIWWLQYSPLGNRPVDDANDQQIFPCWSPWLRYLQRFVDAGLVLLLASLLHSNFLDGRSFSV